MKLFNSARNCKVCKYSGKIYITIVLDKQQLFFNLRNNHKNCPPYKYNYFSKSIVMCNLDIIHNSTSIQNVEKGKKQFYCNFTTVYFQHIFLKLPLISFNVFSIAKIKCILIHPLQQFIYPPPPNSFQSCHQTIAYRPTVRFLHCSQFCMI